ncbi:unnamed protein product [Paramecium pentaurelia]|uniref:Uncharacterized protein n=1 Tax=Paramecium pentaurelia TaxID=43138 RepID=A0A8S1SLL5_9CILI|nr:unnamed protein product [Paramecium pentaurelia]
MSKSSKLSISPLKSQQSLFPTISFKTSESPSKDLIPPTNYMLFQQKQDKIATNQMKNSKQLNQERAETIYKYLRQLVLAKIDYNKEKSNIQYQDPITDSKDTIKHFQESNSSFHYLKKIDNKLSKQKFKRSSKSCIDLTAQDNLCNQIQNNCIIEQDQEQEDCEHNFSHIIKNQLNISPNLYNNFKHNKIYKLSPQNQSNVVLDFNQQNKEYREKNYQIIHMIKNVQQDLLRQRDEDRQKLEKDYKLQKILRQKERKEGLYNAQVGLKDRKFKLLLNALKGSQNKQVQDHLVLNIKRKNNNIGNQSSIISRQSSFQQYNLNYITDNEKLIRKISQISDVCSSETSLDSKCQIQFTKKINYKPT